MYEGLVIRLLFASLIAGCGSEVTTKDAGPAVIRSPEPAPMPTPPGAASAPVDVDEPIPLCPPLLDGLDLARTWPQHVGEQVRMTARIARAVDVTTALVDADGARFAVMLDPGLSWEGKQIRWFSVMGDTQVSDHGGSKLPALLLMDPTPCR